MQGELEEMPKMPKVPKMPKIMVSLAQRRRLRRASFRLYYKRLVSSALKNQKSVNEYNKYLAFFFL
jgi:hypothetical protein